MIPSLRDTGPLRRRCRVAWEVPGITRAKKVPIAAAFVAIPTPARYKYGSTLHIEFDIDRAIIRSEYHNRVDKVDNFMKKYPMTTAVSEGHTDNVRSHAYNMEPPCRECGQRAGGKPRH